MLFLHSRPNPFSQWGTAGGRIFTVPACLPAKLPPLNPQSVCLWSTETQLGTRAEEKWESPSEKRRKRLENLIPATSHTQEEVSKQSMPSSPVSWGEGGVGEEAVGNSSTDGLAAEVDGGGWDSNIREAFFADLRKETIFEAKKEGLWGTFLFPQVLKSSGQLLHTFCSGGHLVAGGTGLVEQVHRTLEA